MITDEFFKKQISSLLKEIAKKKAKEIEYIEDEYFKMVKIGEYKINRGDTRVYAIHMNLRDGTIENTEIPLEECYSISIDKHFDKEIEKRLDKIRKIYCENLQEGIETVDKLEAYLGGSHV